MPPIIGRTGPSAGGSIDPICKLPYRFGDLGCNVVNGLTLYTKAMRRAFYPPQGCPAAKRARHLFYFSPASQRIFCTLNK